jgi:hypothetical protein
MLLPDQSCKHHFSVLVFLEDSVDIAREGRPLLTVETEANGDLCSTNERGPLLVACWFVWPAQEIFILYGLLRLAKFVKKIFFLCRTLFYFLCRHRLATWAGRRAGSPFS